MAVMNFMKAVMDSDVGDEIFYQRKDHALGTLPPQVDHVSGVFQRTPLTSKLHAVIMLPTRTYMTLLDCMIVA